MGEVYQDLQLVLDLGKPRFKHRGLDGTVEGLKLQDLCKEESSVITIMEYNSQSGESAKAANGAITDKPSRMEEAHFPVVTVDP